MFNKWRAILLGLVISQGFSIVAMEEKSKSPRTPQRNVLSCSAEVRKEGELMQRAAALRVSAEVRKEEKRAQSSMYHQYCGGGFSPQDLSPGLPYDYVMSSCYRSDCP